MKLATKLVYADGRIEGQVLHQGDEESCNQLREMLQAISVSGEPPKEAYMQNFPDDFPFDVGQRYSYKDGKIYLITLTEREPQGALADGDE